MFLMPSRYEPCGLNQIYSLKYGTVPIVRATGGLDDTIEPWDARTGKGTGFKFTEYNGESLLLTIKQALHAFRDQTSWQALMRNGMNKDFSWNASAREYGKVYERAKRLRGAAPAGGKGFVFECCTAACPIPICSLQVRNNCLFGFYCSFTFSGLQSGQFCNRWSSRFHHGQLCFSDSC